MASPSVVFVTETLYSTVPAMTSRTATTRRSLVDSGPASSSADLSNFITSVLSNISPTATATVAVPDISTLPSHSANPASSHSKFNGSSITAIYVVVSMLSLLLFSLLAYSVWAQCLGGRKCKCGAPCANCKDLQDKLHKWERGDIKRITKEMVKQREAYNNQMRSSHKSATPVPANVDLEMGPMDHESARAATLDALEGRPSRKGMPNASLVWDGVKAKFHGTTKDKGKQLDSMRPVARPDPVARPETGDRFFTVETSPVPPQLAYQPPDTPFYPLPSHQFSASDYSASIYSQSTNVALHQQKPDSHGLVNKSFLGSVPAPAPAPRTYSSYLTNIVGPRDKQRKILLAEGDLTSRAYKEAEAAMARDSIASSELNRHIKVVNRVDQGVQRARHPSLYSSSGRCEEDY